MSSKAELIKELAVHGVHRDHQKQILRPVTDVKNSVLALSGLLYKACLTIAGGH